MSVSPPDTHHPAPPPQPTGAAGPPGAAAASSAIEPVTPRAFSCRCGRPVFFRNSECLACHTPLGYDPASRRLLPLEPAPPTRAPLVRPLSAAAQTAEPPVWREAGGESGGPRWRRCHNLDTAAACNWLLAEQDRHAGSPALCRCCRLTRTLPDLSVPEHGAWWNRIELAKRRLVSSLIALKLPVLNRQFEDPKRGLAFDLLRASPGAPPVVTGHDDGIITLDVEEADDAWREQRRAALSEPYRTLLGHLRHETGHYYWQRLVEHTGWHQPFRQLFGDERQDYAQALKRHYSEGSRADWVQHFVSAYASSHPWEDWAETWAHYLHLRDTLDTAASFGLDGERVELHYERFSLQTLGGPDGAQARGFLRLLNSWMELTGVLNELSRSMGVHDFYPFVLSAPAVRKLYFVHRVIAAGQPQPVLAASTGSAPSTDIANDTATDPQARDGQGSGTLQQAAQELAR